MFERSRIIGNILYGALCISLSVYNNFAPLADNADTNVLSGYSAAAYVTTVNDNNVQIGTDSIAVNEIRKEQFITKTAIDAQRRELVYEYNELAKEQAEPTAEEQGQMIADIAESMVGTSYQYAGESQSGVDCSGLVVYCYAQMGIDLPHSSYSLCSVGTEVSVEDIRPGDIICWDNQGGSCGHVGIYVGDGQMVDARGHSDGVIYGDLDLHPILTVRRIFTD